jgi:YVTN family beta-propeller protein
MTYATRSVALAALVCALLVACSETPSQPELIIPAAGDPIVYSRHVQPIFTRSCALSGCHAGSAAGAAALSLESWDLVMAGSLNGAMVVPFAPRRSHLLQHISTDSSIAPRAEPHMPFNRGSLPLDQILLIKRWIVEGAKNDAGEIALSGDRPRVFAACQSEDAVAAIDLRTLRLARLVPVGRLPDTTNPPEAPHNIAVSPDGAYFYVNLIATGEVEKFDAVGFTKLATARVGRSPAQIIVSSDGNRLYVSNFDQTFTERFVSVVDTRTMVQVTALETGGRGPHGIALSRDERTLYTANAGSDDISEIDLENGDVRRIIPIVPGEPLAPDARARHEPYQAVLSVDGATLFVTCRASAQVRAIDVASGRVVDSISVGRRPLILEMTPDGRELWVPNQADGTVSIIDATTHAALATVGGLTAQPHAVAFTRDGRTAFVTCENQSGEAHHPIEGAKAPGLVWVVDVASRRVIRSIEVGSFAAGIAIRE